MYIRYVKKGGRKNLNSYSQNSVNCIVLREVDQIYRKIYLFLLMALAFSLPLSVFLSSLLQLLLSVLWFAEGRFPEKWRRLKSNPAFWIFSSFYLLHLLGMLWSADTAFGLKDLRIKLPIFALPFFMVTFDRLTMKEISLVLVSFIGGCLTASIAIVLALVGIIPVELEEYRNASLFISHIRYSLMIVMGWAIGVYFLFFNREPRPAWFRILMIIAAAWFPPFLLVLKSLSGIVILVLLVLVMTLILLKLIRRPTLRWTSLVIVAAIPVITFFYLKGAIDTFYDVEEVDRTALDSLTAEGNPYKHRLKNFETENGNYVWLFVCHPELEREWNRKSTYDYNGKTDNGSGIKYTLIRYMASKGLRKDAAGMQQLAPEDIRAVERGIANHIFLKKMALYPRIYEVIWEVDRTRMGYSPNDKSLVQRYHYLKAGLAIALDHPWIGVGTGDVAREFDSYYEQVDSPLRTERRRRAHNQLLTLAITFGIPGFAICIFALLYPVFKFRKWRSYMLVVFLIIAALSMLNEDTLETTTGSVFFALFYGLFVFGPSWPWRPDAATRKPVGPIEPMKTKKPIEDDEGAQ